MAFCEASLDFDVPISGKLYTLCLRLLKYPQRTQLFADTGPQPRVLFWGASKKAQF